MQAFERMQCKPCKRWHTLTTRHCLLCILFQVSRLAGVLVKNGVRKGDLVVIYMPMVPQAMFTMLACARIGAPHSLIFGGFASKELSVRINHAKVRKSFYSLFSWDFSWLEPWQHTTWCLLSVTLQYLGHSFKHEWQSHVMTCYMYLRGAVCN